MKRILTTIAALGVTAGAIAGASTTASAANVGIYFGVPGLYSSPPPSDRECWRWSHRSQSWEWTCSRPHPDNMMFDRQHHRWNNH
jgi:hypothetical protein